MSETTPDLATFRAETRAWLEANCPPEMRRPIASEDDICWGGRNWRFQSDAQRLWLERMAGRGWTVPSWPRDYGGGGLSADEAKVLAQEMRSLGCRPPLQSFGIWMLGPALQKFGNDEQKREHLPKIARGEIRWCQGYSEPNAGSDLASLQTRAEDRGDHYVVNGSKVWTSYADKADWIFCLVRSESAAKKHTGISFVLFDMATPGVSTKPIGLISGKSPFCETFFDDVRVDKRHLVGKPGSGWDVAKYLLTHEREMIGGVGDRQVMRPTGQVAADRVGRDAQGRLDDPLLRAQIAEFEVDEAAFRATMERFGELAKAKQAHPAFSSMLKYYGAELNKRRHELLMAAGGSDALEWESERSNHGTAARTWLRTKANSIEGGTSEVQLNVIAKRILELPGGLTMALVLNEEQALLRDSARDFLAEQAPVAQLRALRDARDADGYSRRLWNRFAEMGYTGVLVPETHGGLGLGHAEVGVVMEQIGRHLTASPLLASGVVAATAIRCGGTAAQQQALLPQIASGQHIATLAVDEAGKHRPERIALQARRSGDGWRLDGAKTFVLDGHVADTLVVAARTAGAVDDEAGITLFLVPRIAPGVAVERVVMVDAHNAARAVFTDVAVGAAAVLGEVDGGRAALNAALDAGRCAASAELLGLADEAFERTLAYLKERRQFDRLIGEFQGLQHRAATLYCDLELARAAVARAAQSLDAGREGASLDVSIAKARAGRSATLAVQEAVQMHGGIGMTDEFEIGFFMKRARVLQELFGDANFHADRLARSRGY